EGLPLHVVGGDERPAEVGVDEGEAVRVAFVPGGLVLIVVVHGTEAGTPAVSVPLQFSAQAPGGDARDVAAAVRQLGAYGVSIGAKSPQARGILGQPKRCLGLRAVEGGVVL